MSRVRFEQHDRWYAVEATGADSVYSDKLCGYCARPVRPDAARLLTARSNDGEWWLVSADEDMKAPEWSDFQNQLDGTFKPTPLPFGPDCLRKHPEWWFASAKTTSDNWCSPPEIAEPLADHFKGPVDIDPCSNERSIIQARLALYHGGLVVPWRLKRPVNRTGYENDPYSMSAAWTAKMIAELAAGNIREHVRLCMMATSTTWWADQCLRTRRNPRILALKRISFLDPYAASAGQKRESCRFEPALLYWGPNPARFTRTFAHLTRWATWGRA